MKKSKIALPGLVLLLLLCSCKKFLEVQSKEEVFESALLRTPTGVYSMLNGIYQGLADQDLYGKQLTMGYLDVLAGYYPNKASIQYTSRPSYYTSVTIRTILEAIWRDQYHLLLEINILLRDIEAPGYQVLPVEQKNLLLGELYGLRAFLHFDLLRLFGPIFSLNPETLAIPYNQAPDIAVQPILPASEVLAHIRQDLDRSLILLKKDPVLQYKGGLVQRGAMDYFSLRYFRFNYYASLLLSARINLYAGDRKQALEQSVELINATENKFPFIANQAQAVADPIFSSEAVFAIQNRDLNSIYNTYFNPIIPEENILYPDPVLLAGRYPSENDYRYLAWSSPGNIAEKNYRIFSKYSNIKDKIAPNLQDFQPLIRKSEAYLIAAEAEPDLNKAYSYLSTLQIARGLEPDQSIPSSSKLAAALLTEYTREFWGEGQLFFYLKRKNIMTIPGLSGSLNYLPPLPPIEDNLR